MPKLLEINHQRNEIIEEQRYSSTHIANILRLSRPKSMSSGDLKFAQIGFYEADLSMANLTNLDISNSDFVRVDVSKAVLKPAKFDNSFWGGVKWWEAAEISAPFLSYLIENAGPYTHGGEEDLLRGEGTPSVTREDYVRIIDDWCKKVQITCDLEHLRFGRPRRPPILVDQI